MDCPFFSPYTPKEQSRGLKLHGFLLKLRNSFWRTFKKSTHIYFFLKKSKKGSRQAYICGTLGPPWSKSYDYGLFFFTHSHAHPSVSCWFWIFFLLFGCAVVGKHKSHHALATGNVVQHFILISLFFLDQKITAISFFPNQKVKPLRLLTHFSRNKIKIG